MERGGLRSGVIELIEIRLEGAKGSKPFFQPGGDLFGGLGWGLSLGASMSLSSREQDEEQDETKSQAVHVPSIP